MKTTKTLAWVVALGGVATSFLSCSEPQTACTVGLAGSGLGYAVKFTPKGAMPACASAPGYSVAQRGDIIGMEFYHPASADGSTYNVHVTTISLQSDTLGLEAANYAAYNPPGYTPTYLQTPAQKAAAAAAGQQLFATAAFTSEDPDSNNQCAVTNSSWQPAKQSFPAVAAEPAGPMMMPPALPALPADAWEYQWSNMQVYVTAADQGVQFAADLTLTETVNGTACAVDYHAVGLWPAVSCTDANGNPDLDMCNPCAEPALGRATGSGISPDAQLACAQIFDASDPRGPYYCVLAGMSDPPVLNPNPPTCEGNVMSLGTGPSGGTGGSGTGGSGTGGSGTGGSSGDAGPEPGDAGTD